MAYTFLNQASFGATTEELEAAIGTSATDWVSAQMAIPHTEVLDEMVARYAARDTSGESLFAQMQASWWTGFLHGEDQLRQRAAFALSQIVVRSETTNEPMLRTIATYDLYQRHALGNYADFLEDVTYSVGMGDFLTYLHSAKENESTGRMPDENYAREIMQLFTIGLVELNMDGTPKLDGQGTAIENYSNEDVVGLARVFTGFKPHSSDNESTRYIESLYKPMRQIDSNYEFGEKTFLGYTIAENTPPRDNVRQAIDVLVAHDSFPPFISRQMIQRMTQSNPSPAYVERVATAFANGSFTAADGATFGDGRRGDMKALMAAIVLDAQFFDDLPPALDERKLREPILRMAHILRALEFSNDDPEMHRYVFSRFGRRDKLAMAPMRAPSVFNYYRPGHVALNSQTGAAGLTAPELQLITPASIRGYSDALVEFIYVGMGNNIDPERAFLPVFSRELELQNDPVALVDHLDSLLVNGALDPVTRQRIYDALTEMPVRDDDRYRDKDRLSRVMTSIWFVATSTDFAVTQ